MVATAAQRHIKARPLSINTEKHLTLNLSLNSALFATFLQVNSGWQEVVNGC
jgi:hypothetical protein